MKKIISTLLTVLFAVLTCSIPAFAFDKSNNSIMVNGIEMSYEQIKKSNNEIINIKSPDERINSNGTFDFMVRGYLTSDKFKVDGSTVTISINASIENSYGQDVTNEYPNHRYSIVLYKNQMFGGKVDEDTFYADGQTYEFTAIGLKPNVEYYFQIFNNDELPAGTNVVGYGEISNYVHI